MLIREGIFQPRFRCRHLSGAQAARPESCRTYPWAIDGEIDDTVFSYIPNTAESAFFGMAQGFNEYLNKCKARRLSEPRANSLPDSLRRSSPAVSRTEKVAWKDIKLRTFISEGSSRNDLAAHVYDITYGSLRPGVDNLVVIDDSIVRGTTLCESILRILDRSLPSG